MTTTGWPCRLGVVVHLTLVCPCGQRAVQVCREAAKTLLVVSHDEAVLAAGDRLLDMTMINARAEAAG